MPASSPGETSSSSAPKPPPLGPAPLHPENHLGPVLGVGAAGAGVHCHQSVAGVVAAGEQPLLLELVETLLHGLDLLLELLGESQILLG